MGTINNGVIDASAFRGTGSANPNPPSFNPSGWDVENTLWLAGGAISNSGQAWDITTPPTNFTLVRYDDGTQQSIASAQRNSQAASMDPETFGTTSSGTSWQAWTIAIRPGTIEPVVTLAATSISTGSAQMNGRLDVLFSASATVRFEYGDTVSLGNDSSDFVVTSTGTFGIIVGALQENHKYYFRAFSEEIPSGYTDTGEILNFTTRALDPSVRLGFEIVPVFLFIALMTLMVLGAWTFSGRRKK